MKIRKLALCTAALLSIASSCFALDTGYYYRLSDDKLFTITVLSHEGQLKGESQNTRLEFAALQNSVNETYSTLLMKTGTNTYASTSGLVTTDNDEQGRMVDGTLKGLRIGYDRMGQKEGDFTIEDLGNGKLKVSSNVGLVKGFGYDGIYTREETFVAAPPGLALHALEVVAKKTQYLAIDDIDYHFRVMNKEDGSGYSIMARQPGADPAMFHVNIGLYNISFIWNNSPIMLFQHKAESK